MKIDIKDIKGDDNNDSRTREVNIKLKYEIKVIIKIENI